MGYWRMPNTKEDIGAYLLHASERLAELFTFIDPDTVVAFEQPIGARAKFNDDGEYIGINTAMATLRKLYSYAGLVELEAVRRAHHVVEVPVQSVKKALTGSGAAKKEDMVAAYHGMGLPWPDGLRVSERHNVADALGVWVMMAGKLAPKSAAERTPLFAQAR
jgi:hypothetical protein